jgi:hypothetical protein
VWLDLWVSGVIRCERPPRAEISNSLVWLLGSCAVFTNLVITLYWEDQWTCGLLHWNVNFNTVPWSTLAAPELSIFKSYDQIIMKVRTCPNWLSELIGPDLSKLNLLDPPCPNWSTCLFFFASSPCIAAPPLSHIYLSTTNVEYLGSITFSDMLKLISARREFTSYCSFMARLRVIGPWFIFIGVLCSSTCVTTRLVGMSAPTRENE